MIYLAISIGIFGLAVALAYFNDSKKKNSTI
jgi:predicted ribosomally synthesized peptide with SipW-like signal peptide